MKLGVFRLKLLYQFLAVILYFENSIKDKKIILMQKNAVIHIIIHTEKGIGEMQFVMK
jgi:hypothetical protein